MKKLFGNKEFYKLVAALALPLLLQNAVSTFVNLLDNLMVGRVGTESMSGVSIVNQLIFVFNLCIFGGTGGAGIFGAQFHGRGDTEGVRHTLRFNILLCLGFSAIAVAVLHFGQDFFIRAFLHDTGAEGDLELTFSEARDYLRVMLAGLPPFALTMAYVSILRVTGDNRLPMRASTAAILVNLVFNYFLIYGKCGFPCLGVEGAAIATVMSRYVELALILLGSHRKRSHKDFVRGVYRGFSIPLSLAGKIAAKGAPLLVNEMFWSFGQTMLTQNYSYKGLEAVAALNICSTMGNFFNMLLFTMGNVVGIVLGNLLGADEFDRARDYCPKLISISFLSCAFMGALMFLAAPVAPHIYKTSESIMTLAASLMRVFACMLPLHALSNCSYWSMRAGGRTYITMLFDSVFTWIIVVPTAWALIRFTSLTLLQTYAIVSATEVIKSTVGIILVRRGIWVRNIVSRPAEL